MSNDEFVALSRVDDVAIVAVLVGAVHDAEVLLLSDGSVVEAKPERDERGEDREGELEVMGDLFAVGGAGVVDDHLDDRHAGGGRGDDHIDPVVVRQRRDFSVAPPQERREQDEVHESHGHFVRVFDLVRDDLEVLQVQCDLGDPDPRRTPERKKERKEGKKERTARKSVLRLSTPRGS